MMVIGLGSRLERGTGKVEKCPELGEDQEKNDEGQKPLFLCQNAAVVRLCVRL